MIWSLGMLLNMEWILFLDWIDFIANWTSHDFSSTSCRRCNCRSYLLQRKMKFWAFNCYLCLICLQLLLKNLCILMILVDNWILKMLTSLKVFEKVQKLKIILLHSAQLRFSANSALSAVLSLSLDSSQSN